MAKTKIVDRLRKIQMPKLPHQGFVQEPQDALVWNLALAEKLMRRGHIESAKRIVAIHSKIVK